jgi:hypothetical protein
MSKHTEAPGDIILGTPFVRAFNRIDYDNWCLLGGTLTMTSGHLVYNRKDPSGSVRVIDNENFDPSRAKALYRVVSVSETPKDSGGYGGGPTVLVERLDGTRERILYQRRCGYSTDVSKPVELPEPLVRVAYQIVEGLVRAFAGFDFEDEILLKAVQKNSPKWEASFSEAELLSETRRIVESRIV